MIYRTGKQFLQIRKKKIEKRDSVLQEQCNRIVNSILIEDYEAKRLTLYNRRGHTQIIKTPLSVHSFS